MMTMKVPTQQDLWTESISQASAMWPILDEHGLMMQDLLRKKTPYQDGLTTGQIAWAYIESHNTQLRHIVRLDDILVVGYSFGSGSSWEQPSTSILANRFLLLLH